MTFLIFLMHAKVAEAGGSAVIDSMIATASFYSTIQCLIVNLIIVEGVWTKLIKVNLVLNVYSNVVVCKTVYLQFAAFVFSNCHNLYPICFLIEQADCDECCGCVRFNNTSSNCIENKSISLIGAAKQTIIIIVNLSA